MQPSRPRRLGRGGRRQESVTDLVALQSFICPITRRVMMDPVITSDGHSYERVAVEAWFKAGKRTSPLTGAVLKTLTTVQNHTLRLAIEEYLLMLERKNEAEEDAASPVRSKTTTGQMSVEDLAAADEQHRQALASLPSSSNNSNDSANPNGGSSTGGDNDNKDDGPLRVAAYLEARARLDLSVATRYAAAFAEHGYETLAFVSMGEFSRRTLTQQLGILPGHAAPILRAIQALPPPPPPRDKEREAEEAAAAEAEKERMAREARHAARRAQGLADSDTESEDEDSDDNGNDGGGGTGDGGNDGSGSGGASAGGNISGSNNGNNNDNNQGGGNERHAGGNSDGSNSDEEFGGTNYSGSNHHGNLAQQAFSLRQGMSPPQPPRNSFMSSPQSPSSPNTTNGSPTHRKKLSPGEAEASECAALVGLFLALGGVGLGGAVDPSVDGWAVSKGWDEATLAAEEVATKMARKAGGRSSSSNQHRNGRTAKLSATSQVPLTPPPSPLHSWHGISVQGHVKKSKKGRRGTVEAIRLASNRLHLAPSVRALPLSYLRQLPALKYLNLGGAHLNCTLAPASEDAAQALQVKQAAENEAAAAGAAAAAAAVELTAEQSTDQSEDQPASFNAGENIVRGSSIPPLMRANSDPERSLPTARPSSALPPLASPRSSPRLILASQSEPTTPITATFRNREGIASPAVRIAWNESSSIQEEAAPTVSHQITSPATNATRAAAPLIQLVAKPFHRWPSGLLELRLFECGLEGPLPLDLNQLRRIKVISLWGNRLTGPLPSSLLTAWGHSLLELDLSQNAFSGPIPVRLGPSCPRLKSLDLRENKFRGSIPESLGSASSLETLFLSGNELTGLVPSSLGDNCTKLQFLGLATNHLSGPLPNSIGKCQRLTHLALHNNMLSGCVPYAVQHLSNLACLQLWRNRLTGVADGLDLRLLTALHTLNLAKNPLEQKEGLERYLARYLPPTCQVYL